MTALSNSRAISNTPNADNTLTTAQPHKTTPWWLELIRVDFRHALLPWLVYVAAVFSIWFLQYAPLGAGPETPNYWPYIMAVIGLAAPSVVSLLFAADFHQATIATLLSTPRKRSAIFWTRIALLSALYLVPALIVAIPLPHPWTAWTDAQQYILSAAIVTVVMMGLFYTAIGALLSILLKRPLLVWSAVTIAPLVVLVFSVIIENVTGINLGIQAGETLTSPVGRQFWFFLLVDVAALLAAWRLWLRLEVNA